MFTACFSYVAVGLMLRSVTLHYGLEGFVFFGHLKETGRFILD